MALDELQEPQGVVKQYVEALYAQIDQWGKALQWEELRTIYIGGGTPSTIGAQELINIIEHIQTYRSLAYLEELTIELNPYPYEVLDLVQAIAQQYKHFPRVRFSIGVQSFDQQVLEESGRKYGYQGMVDWLRKLAPLKTGNMSINLDFIAFGKFHITRKGNKQLWHQSQRTFFRMLAESGFVDGFSLYTLELFEWSKRFYQLSHTHTHQDAGFGLYKYGDDDAIYEEFSLLKDMIVEAGYQRYEISNFARGWQNSIHNMVYWSMNDYIALGTGASGFVHTGPLLDKIMHAQLLPSPVSHSEDSKNSYDYQGVRWSTTKQLNHFLSGDPTSIVPNKNIEWLTPTAYDTEYVFLALRTSSGLADIRKYEHVLEGDREQVHQLLLAWEKQWLVVYTPLSDDQSTASLVLTDMGMDVYNTLVTELLELK